MIFSEYTGTGKTKSMCKCHSIAGVKCERRRKGEEKTIPWCLAHTASRNAHWAGALGRLHPLQPFPTIVTTLNPLKSNGIIIHPTQDRFITVREAARAQSFPDSFHFSADRKSALKQVIEVVQNNKPIIRILYKWTFITLTHKRNYFQIGNAVPPLLARAIGTEMRTSMKCRRF
jgi:site-specific DNA-cytosine methylase